MRVLMGLVSCGCPKRVKFWTEAACFACVAGNLHIACRLSTQILIYLHLFDFLKSGHCVAGDVLRTCYNTANTASIEMATACVQDWHSRGAELVEPGSGINGVV